MTCRILVPTAMLSALLGLRGPTAGAVRLPARLTGAALVPGRVVQFC